MKTDRSFDDCSCLQKFSPNSSGRHSRSSLLCLQSFSPPSKPASFQAPAKEMTHQDSNTSYIFSFLVLAEDFPLLQCIFLILRPHSPAWALGISALPCGHLCITVGEWLPLLRSYWFLVLVSLISLQPHAEWSFLAGLKVSREEESYFSLFCSVLISDGLGWIGLQTR